MWLCSNFLLDTAFWVSIIFLPVLYSVIMGRKNYFFHNRTKDFLKWYNTIYKRNNPQVYDHKEYMIREHIVFIYNSYR